MSSSPLESLAAWAAGLRAGDLPSSVAERLEVVLASVLGVTAVGAADRGALVEAWDPPPGPSVLIGTGRSTTPDAAAWLNATALVSLELDEGNRFAGGHPAAHGWPAVLALAGARDADGPTTAAALVVAYEVAARFGRATRLRPGTHPHGTWGATGAAAGCARLMGLPPAAMAAAVDAAAGMAIAGPFTAALDGNPVRDEWVGAANQSGLAAARLAAARFAEVPSAAGRPSAGGWPLGMARHSLGGLLGTFDEAALSERLGERWDLELGYFKRHASCAYTHPTADAVLELRPHLALDDIDRVDVETYTAAASLDRIECPTRLAAMFSVPFVVATALREGAVRPDAFTRIDAARPLMNRVHLAVDPDIDARVPEHRGARVRIRLRSGETVEAAVDDPIGDAARGPFGRSDVEALLADLLGSAADAERVCAVAQELPWMGSVRRALQELP
ncbi:MmgE/PrpD family protein [Cryptosporangium sp. NPDC048952]|uniref:MmgE/PrpD family protein n=1 Tax=Cryptosporangium sp. NPDC048952 TaxID=3363961 RepID=UPI0037152B38